jgi:hypothetical protein
MAKTLKCLFCGMVFNNDTVGKRNYGTHLDTQHADQLPKDISCGNEYVYLITTKPRPNIGKCMMCPRKAPWNDSAYRYGKLCSKLCRDKYRDIAKQRMVRTYGKDSLMSDPQHQVKMLKGRKISGEYVWPDKTRTSYVGSYELDFLKYMDEVMNWDAPADIISNEPDMCFIPYKLKDGTDSTYIPDFFILNLRLLVEIKASSKNDKRDYRREREEVMAYRLPQLEGFLRDNNMYYVIVFDKEYGYFDSIVEMLTDNVKRHALKQRIFVPSNYRSLLKEDYQADTPWQMLQDMLDTTGLLEADYDIDEVYERWREWVNISAADLEKWKSNPISKLASVDPAAVIDRNIKLLKTPRSKWNQDTAKEAMRTISFNSRMSNGKNGKPVRKDIPFSKRDISLINWAYLPSTVDEKDFKYWISAEGISKANEILSDK